MRVTAAMQKKIGLDTLERYTGSTVKQFQPYILLTNFFRYVEIFAEKYNKKINYGSAMSSCHVPKHKVSIIDYGVGSPVAAMTIEMLSHLKPQATLMLAACGGLRPEYKVGDYFNPVAAIREEGTSFAYLPERCPSLSSFVIQRHVCHELERNNTLYHTGVIHTTNVRMWEFKKDFIQKLHAERSQAIDMECATLFTVGFALKVPVGALTLITDLPLKAAKTKASASKVIAKHSKKHVEMGINVLRNMQKKEPKGFGYSF